MFLAAGDQYNIDQSARSGPLILNAPPAQQSAGPVIGAGTPAPFQTFGRPGSGDGRLRSSIDTLVSLSPTLDEYDRDYILREPTSVSKTSATAVGSTSDERSPAVDYILDILEDTNWLVVAGVAAAAYFVGRKFG
jgi:hypothetical protein